MLTAEEKQARKLARIEAREAENRERQIQAEKDQKPVKTITITIKWKKSRTWGLHPHAEAAVEFQDGTFERRNGYTASGCGYDKESTVIAAIFNDFLKYKLHTKIEGDAPYGMYYGTRALKHIPEYICYNGGVGTSCYYRIAKFIGGSFENIASGNTFDVYKYTEGQQ